MRSRVRLAAVWKKIKDYLNFFPGDPSESVTIEFRCPFRVGIEVLLATRLGQRPKLAVLPF